ncbi:MAG: superoxide dismutase [Chloroflexi bacterium]|nr:superoxide dismutase [Chloroflexota bacterium]
MTYPFKLPDLPYATNALEPHIGTRIMALHHDKHHAGYVNKLNAALENHPELHHKSVVELLQDLDALPDDIRTAVRNNGGGHLNHSIFWPIMSPKGGGEPSGKLADAINAAFGSFADFKSQFSQSAATLFGSGWTWLAMTPENSLVILNLPNQDTPVSQGLIPIMGIDVWEHAYYLTYENRRGDYIAAWWNIVNWDRVAQNYLTALARHSVDDFLSRVSDFWSKLESTFKFTSD